MRTVHIWKAQRERENGAKSKRERERHENKNTYRVKELMVRVIRTTIHKCNRWFPYDAALCVVLCCMCVFFHFSWLFSSAFIDKTAIIIMFLFSFFFSLLLLLLDDEWCYRFTRFIFSVLCLVCCCCCCLFLSSVCVCMLFFHSLPRQNDFLILMLMLMLSLLRCVDRTMNRKTMATKLEYRYACA